MAARLKELNCQVSNDEKLREAGRSTSEAAVRQMHQLWQNSTKDAVEELPYAQWLVQGKWELTQLPTSSMLEKLRQIAKRREPRKPTKMLIKKEETSPETNE